MLVVAAVSVVAIAKPASGVEPRIFNGVDKVAMERWVESTYSQMSDDERIAQIIVMCLSPRYTDETRARLVKLVKDNKVGGLLFNEGTIMEHAQCINFAQEQATVPLMIALDGEWGLSMRMSDAVSYPRNLTLGSIDNDKVLYDYGREVARQCRLMGISVDFAPVLDVIDKGANGIIGNRSFGESPEMVSRHALAFARGLEDGRVLSVAKHFPGHGSTITDSHKALPVVEKSRNELVQCELLPFNRYVDAGLSGVMTGHLRVPAIDARELPSTMSEKYVSELLKGTMRFQGLVFTDALGMGGAKVNGSKCVHALKAGNDVLLMPTNVEQEIAAIKAAIANGELQASDIESRCKKMLRFKYALGLSTKPVIDLATVEASVNGSRARVVEHKLCANSITVVKNDKKILPVKNLQSKKIALITIGDSAGKASMIVKRCESYAQVSTYALYGGSNARSVTDHAKADATNLAIVAVMTDDAASRETVKAVCKEMHNVVLVLTCKVADMNKYSQIIGMSNVKGVVMAYEKSELAKDYAIQTVFGGNAASGVLPMTLEVSKDGNTKRLEAGYGIHYPAIRLGYTIPEEVGFNDNLEALVDSVAEYGVSEGAFPGCQVLIARPGKVVYNKAFGHIDFGSEVEVDENTLFGLASVSKATGTLSGIMKLYDEGKLKLDDKVSKFIPGMRVEDKKSITIKDLLYHETGMPPSLSMWNMMFDEKTYTGKLITSAPNATNSIKIMNGAYGHKDAKLRTDILSEHKTSRFNIAIADGIWGGKVTYDSIMNRIYNIELGKKKYLYSCLNFCLLADALQRITGTELNTFVDNNVFAPLGAYHTMYRPLSKFSGNQIAYTEQDTYLRRQHIHGYVHDELAAFSGGVQGNAGLFSNANDLAKLFQMWLNGGEYGGTRMLKKSTVDTFLNAKSPNSHRGLGFDKPNLEKKEYSSTCDEATPETVGHTGFTGTCYWVDPKNDMIYIFLSNRVSPTRNNPAFTRVSARSHIHSIIYSCL